MKILVVFYVCFFVPFQTFAADPYLDKNFRVFEKEYWAGFDECLKIRSTPNKKACEDALEEKMKDDPRNRRSGAFFKQHYEPLDVEALNAALIALIALYEEAPSYMFESSRPPGVLSRKLLEAEAAKVSLLLRKRRQGKVTRSN